jgi:TPR repeat protein
MEANAALAQKDYITAFAKFSLLAQHGNAIAQFNTGAFLLNGTGTQKDEKLAFEWFAKSAAQGNARAEQVIQSWAAKGNEYAKNAAQSLHPATAAAAPSVPNVEPKASVAAAPAHTEVARPAESSASNISFGANLGRTSKLSGIVNSPSFGVLAAYKFTPNIGVELAYNSLYRNANANNLISTTNPGATGTFDLSSVSVAGQYAYALNSDWSLLGKLGFHKSSFKIKSTSSAASTGTSSGALFGLQAQYELNKNLALRGGFDTYIESGGMTGNITEVGMGVIFKF